MNISRRQFGVAALGATVPAFLHKTGLAIAGDARRQIAPLPGLKDNRVLVVVQLAGGNDGLNTLVPHGDDLYYKSRPRLAIEKDKVLKINDRVGLHPEMVELKKLYDDGALGVVTNVGYPNPSRSHFRSTDIWETASASDKMLKTGWIGRYFDHECAGSPSVMLGIRVGEQPALAFAAAKARAATFVNPSMLEAGAKGIEAAALDKMSVVEPTGIAELDFLQRVGNETRTVSRRIREAVRDTKSAVSYPPFAFCRSLKLVAQMIAAEAPTRIYYVTLGGFDTHGAQLARHAALLQELSQGLGLFHQDLKAQGHLDRVLVMTFSEFGRRIDENRQMGTDHGAANIHFVLGGGAVPGLHGSAPDLANRDGQGDVIFKTDFRAVYAAVLKNWLHADPARIIDGAFTPPAIVRG